MEKTKVEILKTLRPKFAQLERQRMELERAQTDGQYFGAAIGFVGTILIFVCAQFLGWTIPAAMVLVAVIAYCAVEYIQDKPKLSNEDLFQQDVGNVIIETAYPELQYESNKSLPVHEFGQIDVFDRFRNTRGQNLIHGKHGDTRFAFSNLKEVYEEGEKYGSEFTDLALVADFHKEIKGKTLVLPDTHRKDYGPWLGKMIQRLGKNGRQLVNLESPEFEKAFVVYSSDQIEARYILTPGMMDSLLQLSRKYGNRISYGFVESKVCVMVDEVFSFRVGVDIPLHTDNIFYNFIYPVEMVKEIIDTLNLNTRIWGR